MKKSWILVSALLGTSLLVTACNPLSLLKKDKEEVPQILTLQPTAKENIQEGHFYVKTNNEFYLLPMTMERSFPVDQQIAKEVNKDRVISFGQGDVLIPTVYKDDTLIFYTQNTVPTFTWERMYDCGYTLGFYNLKVDENTGKASYVFGNNGSNINHNSSAYAAITQLPLDSTAITIDKVSDSPITADKLTEYGTIGDLKADEVTDVELYIGTQYHKITATADSHMYGSMELYQTSDYSLSTEGYASVKIPDYFQSGYYMVNGVGLMRYVNNERSLGTANVDYNVPYFYYKDGKQYNIHEWKKLQGEEPEDEEVLPDYTFNYTLDSTSVALHMQLDYQLKDGEDIANILYEAPTAEVISPFGDVYEFDSRDNGDKSYTMQANVDGAVSGDWVVNVYNLGERKLSFSASVESGNADSFIHSGRNIGQMTVYNDGIDGRSTATIKWENDKRAASVEVISPDGTSYKDSDESTKAQFIKDNYGEKVLALDNVAAGHWTLKIDGEDLGRVWFQIAEDTSAPETEAAEESEPAE